MWNKLVHRRLYEIPECRSVEGLKIATDRQVSTRLYYYAEKIAKIDSVFYHYERANINSITSSKTSIHYESNILFHKLLEDFLKDKGLWDKYRQYVDRSKARLKIQLFIATKDYNLRKKYANLYRDVELNYLKELRKGEKTVIILTHFKLHFLAHLAIKYIHWKNNCPYFFCKKN